MTPEPNKEWFDNGIFKGDFREELISLLDQQKTRDWKEVRGMVNNHYWDSMEPNKAMILHHLNSMIDSKLSSL